MSINVERGFYRPPRFRVGKLRERINVQEATVDESTGQPSRTWANLYANEPAGFEPVMGGETIRGRQVEANTTAIFTVHFRSGYSTELRVQHDSTNYGITRVVRVDGGRKYLELHCKAVAD